MSESLLKKKELHKLVPNCTSTPVHKNVENKKINLDKLKAQPGNKNYEIDYKKQVQKGPYGSIYEATYSGNGKKKDWLQKLLKRPVTVT